MVRRLHRRAGEEILLRSDVMTVRVENVAILTAYVLRLEASLRCLGCDWLLDDYLGKGGLKFVKDSASGGGGEGMAATVQREQHEPETA